MTTYETTPLEGARIVFEAATDEEARTRFKKFLNALVDIGLHQRPNTVALQVQETRLDPYAIERVAEAIYNSTIGDPLDYEVMWEHSPKIWKVPLGASWDKILMELSEEERNEYRQMAQAAINAMQSKL